MKILIPARGGSKRIPQKNIVDLCGKPLISYAIESSLEITEEVYVSTDSPDIEKVAKQYGARVIRRPLSISTDSCPASYVVNHFLETIPDVGDFIYIQPTSPLVTSADVERGVSQYKSGGYDTVMAVYEERQFRWAKDGNPDNFERHNKPLSQDLNSWYVECGAFYVTTKDNFIKNQSLVGGSVGFLVLPKLRAVDIDNFEDLKLVESIIKVGDTLDIT